MNKKVFTTVIIILMLDKTEEIIELLKEHVNDVFGTSYFENVSLIEPNPNLDPSVAAITLQPKSDDIWVDYCEGIRKEKKAQFEEKLLKTGYVKIGNTWETKIEVTEGAEKTA